MLLSLLHFPIFAFESDSVGLYDVIFAFLFLVCLVRAKKLLFLDFVILYGIFLTCALASSFFISDSLFHWLLVTKQIQFFSIFCIWIYFFNRTKISENEMVLGLLIIAYTLSIFGFYKVLIGDCYRLCLIFKEGDLLILHHSSWYR